MTESYQPTRAPHRRLAPTDERSPHAALLIDFDNVTMGIRSNLGQELRKLLDSDIIRGKVSVQRAYADWRRYPQYIVPLAEASIDLIFAPAYGSSKKNATDIRLAIDALEVVFTRPEIGTFILLSGDSDFSSLVLKLKEYGKYVIGVGMQESSSDLLVQNCDEYYSYNSLSGLTAAADMPTEKHDPWVLAAKAIRRMVERRDVMRSDRFKQVMLELDPSFSEKSIGFNKFNRFLTEAASRGILALEKAPNGQYEVALGPRADDHANGPALSTIPDSPPRGTRASGAERRAGQGRREQESGPRGGRPEGRRSRGRDRRAVGPATSIVSSDLAEPPEVDEGRLRHAYDLLGSVVGDLAGSGRPVRDSEVKRLMLDRDDHFDEAALGFRKFNRFLRQAHDEEVIELQRGPEGNYLVLPVESAAAAMTGDGRGPEPKAREKRGRGRRGSRGRKQGGPGAGDAAEPERVRTAAEAAEAEDGLPGASGEAAGTKPETGDDRTAAGAGSPSKARVGLFRRGSRGRSGSESAAAPRPRIGPVDEAAADMPAAGAGPTTASTTAGSEGRDAGARASVGRFRRGSRGGAGAPRGEAAGQRPGEATAADAGAGEDDARGSSLSPGQREVVSRMAREYGGVGRRTAEKLVEQFGDDLFRVIDDEPDRLAEVLSERLARAVVEGRDAELRSGAGTDPGNGPAEDPGDDPPPA